MNPAAPPVDAQATRWTIPGTEIRLIRLTEGPNARSWVFSGETLGRLPEFRAQSALGRGRPDSPLADLSCIWTPQHIQHLLDIVIQDGSHALLAGSLRKAGRGSPIRWTQGRLSDVSRGSLLTFHSAGTA